MKLMTMTLLWIASSSFAAPASRPHEGVYNGVGQFACAYINPKVQRPDALTWSILKTADTPLEFEILGGLTIVNSVPLQIFATETSAGSFVLKNQPGEEKGTMRCSGDDCDLSFTFMNNAIGTTKLPVTLDIHWKFDAGGFSQKGTMHSSATPLFACAYEDRLTAIEY